MKRILYSCFLFTFILLSRDILAQPMNATITVAQCFSPGNNYALGVVVTPAPPQPAPCAGAYTYTWTVVSPPGPGCAAGQTISVPSGTANNFYFPCCGTYSFFVRAYAIGNPLACDVLGPFTSIVECPVTATLTNNTPTLCAGNTATINVQGGVQYTWTPGGTVSGVVFTPTPGATTTYTANGVTAVGCTMQPVVTTVSVQTLNVNITPPSQTVCPGTTVTLNANASATGPQTSGITYQWYEFPPPGGALIGTSSTQTVAPTANAVYSLNAFISTCSVTATNSIDIGTSLSMSIAASSPTVCQNESFTLTGISSATSYTWTQLAGIGTATFNASGSTTLNPTTTFGPGIYSVTAQSALCFADPATVTISLTQFTPTINSSSLAVCPGESFTLTGGGGAANSYTWAPLDPLGIPIQTAAVVGASVAVFTQTAVTTYDVLAESPGGCQNTQTITIGIVPNVTTALAISAVSVCATNPVTITVSGAVNYTIMAFDANTSAILSTGTTSTVVHSPSLVTTYSVYGTAASGYCGSSATGTVLMTSGGNLNISIASTAASGSICAQQSATFTASGALSYTWSPGASLTTTTGATTIASPTVSTTYTVYGSNNGGCMGQAVTNVGIDPTPTVYVVSTAAAVCSGYTSTLTAQGAASYTWTGSNFSIPVNQASISVNPGNGNPPVVGSQSTFTVIGSSAAAGCTSNTFTYGVTLLPPLNITTSVSPIQATTCIQQNYLEKKSFPVDMYAFGASNYVWFPYNPAYTTYSLGPQTTTRPPTSTCYTVTGTTAVCSGTALICINVIPQFTMNVVPPLPAICLNDSIKLSIVNVQASPLAAGPVSAHTYYWYDPPTSPPPSITAQNTPTVVAFPQVTTTYTVEMFDSRLCASLPRLVTVTVLPRPLTSIALPIINNVATNTLCFVGDQPGAPDNKLDLTGYNNNIGLPVGVTPTYTWSGPNKPPTVVTPSNVAGVTVIAPRRLPPVMVFTLVSGYNGIAGCKRVDTISVRVIDCRPVSSRSITFIMDVEKGDTLCSRDCVTYQATTDTLAGGPQTYTWTFDGGLPLTSNLRTPTVCYDLPGTYNVVLAVANPYPKFTTPSGSTAYTSFFKYITVVDYPNVTIVGPGQRKSDTTIKFSQSIVLTATNALTYTWSPHYSISAVTGSIVTVNPTKTTMYIVTGKNSKRCFSSDTINVHVVEDCGDMFVPNAFSPNGDEVNDVLYVRGVCLETLTFMIFNRWGEKVFETNDVNVGWDGTYHGEKMNTGVFVYRLEGKTHEGKGFSKKGNITLIR